MKHRILLAATALLAAGALNSASAGRPSWGVSVGAFLGGITVQVGVPAPPPPPPVVVVPAPPVVVHHPAPVIVYPAPVIHHPVPVVYAPVAVHAVPVGYPPRHGFRRHPHHGPVVWPGAPHCR